MNRRTEQDVFRHQVWLECAACGHRAPFTRPPRDCEQCGGEWIDARYDYDAVRELWPSALQERPFDMWRYQELLPLRNHANRVTMGEGGTPLLHATNLGLMLGCPHIYFKDERQGPTGSFKDRQASLAISVMKEHNVTEAVLSMELQDSGELLCRLEETFSGESALRERWFARRMEDSEKRKSLEAIISEWGPGARLGSFEYHNVDEFGSPLIRGMTFSLSHYVREGGNLRFLPLQVHHHCSRVPQFTSETRMYPIVFDIQETWVDSVTVSFPRGWSVVSIPSDESISGQYGSYSSTYARRGNKIMCYRRFSIEETCIVQRHYESVRDFYEKVRSLDNRQVVLRKEL